MSDGVSTTTQHGWRVTTQKLPILKAHPIEAMTHQLGIAPPEMIFGDNFARIEHVASGWTVEFNAFDALDRVDKTGAAMLKVAYSGDWQRSRKHHYEDIKEVVKPFDWSYTTDYKGTVHRRPVTSTPSSDPSAPPAETLPTYEESQTSANNAPNTASPSSADAPTPTFAPTTDPLPLALLRQPDPILFFDELLLYEDELADNGTSLFSLKVRVMPARLLLLTRFFLRLDDVVFRVRDTRLYVDFDSGRVLREYTAREEKFDVVRARLKEAGGGAGGGGGAEAVLADVSAAMRDPNRLVDVLPVVENEMVGCVVK